MHKKRREKKTFCWNCQKEVNTQDYKKIKEIPTCEKCGVQYPEKPKVEASLSILQDKYLKDRSQENLNRLFAPIDKLTYNIICSKLKGSSVLLEEEKVNDMVQWSLLKLLSYYQNKPEFKIEGSFTQYISKVVLYPLYNKKQQEQDQLEISMQTSMGDKDSDKTLMDFLSEKPYMEGLLEIEEKMFKEEHNKKVREDTLYFLENMLKKFYKINRNDKNMNKKAFSNCFTLGILYKYFVGQKHERFFTEVWRTSPIYMRDCFENSIKVMKEALYLSAIENK